MTDEPQRRLVHYKLTETTRTLQALYSLRDPATIARAAMGDKLGEVVSTLQRIQEDAKQAGIDLGNVLDVILDEVKGLRARISKPPQP